MAINLRERDHPPPPPCTRTQSSVWWCGIVVAQALQRVVEGVVARVAGQTPKAAALGERELKAAALFPGAERSRRARQGQCRVQSYVGAAQGKAGARGGSGRPAFGSEHIGQPRDAQQQEVAPAVRHALRRRCTLWACRRMIHARVSAMVVPERTPRARALAAAGKRADSTCAAQTALLRQASEPLGHQLL